MSSEIGLAKFIQQVKKELLDTYSAKENDRPLLSVDSVELELQVTVKTEGKGGVKINVLLGGELSGGVSRDDVHKVKVQLSPLLSKEQLLKAYYQKNPEELQNLVDKNLQAFLKGNGQTNLNESLVD